MRDRGSPILRRSRDLDALRACDRAQMPFSVAAALLLVLSGISIALVHQMNDDSDGNALPANIAVRMKQTASSVSMQIKEAAYSIAIGTMGSGSSMNESLLHSAFDKNLADFVNGTFPRQQGDMEVSVNGVNISLRFLRVSMRESYPSLDEAELEMNYTMTTVPAYFFVEGNLTVEVRGYGGLLIHHDEVKEKILLPFPLVSNRLTGLVNAMSEGRCEFENLIRYQLAVLAQQRLLNGYGFGSRDDDKGTASVLTQWDVVRAANLALLLEQEKYLRSTDEALKGWIINASADPSEFAPLLDRVTGGGSLDPADLFLVMCGETEVDLSTLFAQSLDAGADVIVLRWLEFMHLLDLVEGAESLIEGGQILLETVIEAVTGEDVLREEMVNWITNQVESHGYSEEYYRYMHFGWPDAIVSIPEQRYVAFNDVNQTFELMIGGTYQIDFPSLDMFSSSLWGEFLEEFREGRFQLGEMLQDFVKSVASMVASSTRLPAVRLNLDPLDKISYIQELETIVAKAFVDTGWFDSALVASAGQVDLKDRLAEDLMRFLDARWMELLGWNESLRIGLEQVVDGVMEEISQQIPDFGAWSSSVIRADLTALLGNSELGIRKDLERSFFSNAQWRMDLLKQAFQGYVGETPFEEISECLAEMIAGIAAGIPGLESFLLSFMARQTSEIRDSLEMRCDPIKIHLSEEDWFELEVEDGTKLRERLDLSTTSDFFTLGGGDDPAVTITMPWEQPTNQNQQPNRHITNLDNLTLTPFSSQWSIELRGMVRISVVLGNLAPPFLDRVSPPGGEVEIPVHTAFALVPTTGWALRGVDYSPTSTLFDEICKFMENVWQYVLDALKSVADGVSQVFDFLKNLFSTLLTYSVKAISLLSEVLQALVSGLQETLSGAAVGVLDLVGGFVESVLGTMSFNTTIFGMQFCVETNVVDLAMGSNRDLLKVSFSMSSLGSIISISSRIVRLESDGYDILVNCTLATDDWRVSLVVDPMMKFFSHFVEVKGIFHGHVLLLYLPEIVQYERQVFSLSDVPGLGAFLSNIPTPIPGVKAKIDGGLEIKFTQPFLNHPLINEYEQNPPGTDAGAEWVELYNPTDRLIDLEGWSIETSHGDQELSGLDGISLMPHSRVVYVFDIQTLDNGGESKLPLSECIVLKDADGNRVDSTPWTTDHYNDAMTWQRSFDGSDRWEFKEGTRGASNGKRLAGSSEIDLLERIVWDSIAKAFGEMEGRESSLDSLADIVSRAIENLRVGCVELLTSCMIEMSLFVEVSLTDLSSSFGAGFSLSLVITDRFVEETLSWLSGAIFFAVEHLTNPLAVMAGSLPVEEMAENIFVRFGAFGEGGMPSMLSSLQELPGLRLETVIEANLACFQTLSGNPVGPWRLGFGILLKGIPSDLLSGLFAVDCEKMADVWLFRGCIFPS